MTKKTKTWKGAKKDVKLSGIKSSYAVIIGFNNATAAMSFITQAGIVSATANGSDFDLTSLVDALRDHGEEFCLWKKR